MCTQTGGDHRPLATTTWARIVQRLYFHCWRYLQDASSQNCKLCKKILGKHGTWRSQGKELGFSAVWAGTDAESLSLRYTLSLWLQLAWDWGQVRQSDSVCVVGLRDEQFFNAFFYWQCFWFFKVLSGKSRKSQNCKGNDEAPLYRLALGGLHNPITLEQKSPPALWCGGGWAPFPRPNTARARRAAAPFFLTLMGGMGNMTCFHFQGLARGPAVLEYAESF